MGTLFVILAGSLWGAMGIFVRGLAKCGLSSIEICFIRMVTAVFLMTIYFLIFKRDALKIRLKDIWVFVGTGVLSLTFFGYCYFTTIQMTSMSVAAVLLYTSPVFVLLLSAILFKEKITKKKIVCVIIAILGCAFVSGIIGGNGANLSIIGILIGLGSGLGYGLYSIFGRYAINKKYGALTITYYSFLFSAVALVFLTNPVQVVQKLSTGDVNINICYVIGTSIVVTILPYIFYTIGLTKIENSKAAVLACIEPIMATAFGFIVFHEILSVTEIVGVVLVIIAIIML
ncbi:MAG: DMT family transporter [Lachnospiraceae bacterium]|nr:DMT family transporter [Lachnospiraceae bacterium]